MAGLTKDELKSALINHGVEMNLSSAKKDELVALYEEFVAPFEEQAGEFSSDDEASSPVKKTKKVSKSSKVSNDKNGTTNELAEENSLIVDGVQLDELDDDELVAYLKKYGVEEIGPIVDSTRSLYRKKLAVLMREATNDQVDNNGQQNGHDEVNGKKLDKSVAEFSADEEEVNSAEDDAQPSVVIRKSSRKATPIKAKKGDVSPLQALGTSLRQRFGASPAEKNEERFTPTPRRSIHSYKVTETTTQTVVKNKDGSISKDTVYNKETTESNGVVGGPTILAKILKVLPGIFMLLIIAALAYYVSSKRAS